VLESNDSDFVLLKLICSGDHAAFQTLYERHGLVILNYLIQLIGNRQQAEDILQEVMLIVWEKAPTYTPDGSVRGWLFGIAKRQALKVSRTKRNHLPLNEEILVTEDSMSNGVMKQITLRTAIYTLPSVEQEALEMVYYRGMTLQEVANMLDVPLNTIKTRLYRARQRLRIYLEKDSLDHA